MGRGAGGGGGRGGAARRRETVKPRIGTRAQTFCAMPDRPESRALQRGEVLQGIARLAGVGRGVAFFCIANIGEGGRNRAPPRSTQRTPAPPMRPRHRARAEGGVIEAQRADAKILQR
eukprot:2054130-Pyramimonas_sp.AAC.1